MIKALIFDLDGVLVLTEEPRFKILKQVILSHNIKIPDSYFRKLYGKTTKAFLKELIKDNEKIVEEISEEYKKEKEKNIDQYILPVEFAVNFVKNHKGEIPLALASMSSKSSIDFHLTRLGISEKFKVIISRDELEKHKPDPEIYFKAAKRLGVLPKECVAIEDSTIGVQSALAAGIKCYVLLNGFYFKKDFTGMEIAGFVKSEEDLSKILSL